MNFITKSWKGILLCLVIAVPCWFLGQTFPIIGGPVFGILLYLTACMVASILVSMVPDRPQITALALALMAAPLASTAAAAVLHGAYYFEWIARPVIG